MLRWRSLAVGQSHRRGAQGELAQLVECCDRTAEVRGSNPLFSILENTSNYVDGRLRGNPLEDLATAKAQAVLHGDSPLESRSHSLTFALREFYGWENWAAANRVPISGHA